MVTVTSLLAKVAGDIVESVAFLGIVEKQRWMFAANDRLGGMTPIMCIKQGRVEEVKALVEKMKAER